MADMRDNRNFFIALLLNLMSVVILSALFLLYRLFILEAMNRDLENENYYYLKAARERESGQIRTDV